MERRRSVLFLVICVFLWSTSGLFVKITELNPIALAGGRSLVTAIAIWVWLRKPRFTFSREQLGGAACMAATFLLFISATRYTSAANAILLQYTAPVWVALFGAWFYGERARVVDWGIIGAIVVGMLLFFGERLSPVGMLGNVLALLGGVTMAMMMLLLRRLRHDSADTILLGNIFTAIIGVPFLFFTPVQPVDVGLLVVMGVLQLALPFVLYSVAIRHLDALETVLIATLEPILNPIWVFLVVGEKPGSLALVGGAIVVGAVAVRAVLAATAQRKVLPAVAESA